jgi:hypothetical protein
MIEYGILERDGESVYWASKNEILAKPVYKPYRLRLLNILHLE